MNIDYCDSNYEHCIIVVALHPSSLLPPSQPSEMAPIDAAIKQGLFVGGSVIASSLGGGSRTITSLVITSLDAAIKRGGSGQVDVQIPLDAAIKRGVFVDGSALVDVGMILDVGSSVTLSEVGMTLEAAIKHGIFAGCSLGTTLDAAIKHAGPSLVETLVKHGIFDGLVTPSLVEVGGSLRMSTSLLQFFALSAAHLEGSGFMGLGGVRICRKLRNDCFAGELLGGGGSSFRRLEGVRI